MKVARSMLCPTQKAPEMPWKPANGHHAIERASASFLFRDGLTQHAHNQLVPVLTLAATRLGLTETMILPPPMQINFVQAGPAPAPIPQQIVGPPAGRALRRTDANRVVEEIVLTGDAVVYSSYAYERWMGFSERLKALLPDVIRYVAATTAIGEVRLEYWDRFDRHPGDSGDEPLINPASALVGNALRSSQGSWHSHVGFFTKIESDRRTLVNLNVDAITSTPGNPQGFSGGVTGQARIYTLAAAQSNGTGNPLGDWEVAYAELDRTHLLLKSVLADIVHPNIATEINLNAQPIQLVG